MGIFDNIQSMMGGAMSGGRGASGGGMGEILGPAVLGGLISAILPGKSGGMMRVGGSTALATLLWNKYKDRVMPSAPQPQASPARPQAAAAGTDFFSATSASTPNPVLIRLIRAMVFAAKSDGHIDDNEKQAINTRLSQMGAGPELAKIASNAINEPLDPALVAAGVSDPEEAMTIFVASCSVINLDHFMENSYIDALAVALGIPVEAKHDVMAASKQD